MHPFYESELEAIRSNLLLMGQRCVESVRKAVQALEQNDGEAARTVIRDDDAIDEVEKSIDNACVRYISLRSPVATDVRLLMLAMKACHDLERVGDEACSIAKRVPEYAGELPLRIDPTYIPELAERALQQLQDALNAFSNRDSELAHTVTRQDKSIDQLHREHIHNLLSQPQDNLQGGVPACVDLILISKSLERIGDHAKNVAESVIFLLEAEDVRHTYAAKGA